MNRRDSVAALMAMGIAPTAAHAQPKGKVYRIGYLSAPTRASVEGVHQAFLRALRELGWVEGQNLIIEYRWAEGKIERLPELAAELVRLNVDLIVAPANTAAVAAKAATSSIPIVMIFPVDPVGLGLVASLSRPGGNVTGTASAHGAEIFGKQLQILKEIVPNATRIARLSNPAALTHAAEVKEVDSAAQYLRVRLQHVQARGPEEYDKAFAAMASEGSQALLVSNDTTFLVHAARIAELALKYRLPTMCRYREIVEAGGLMSYWVNMADFIGRSATYVDKILKGAKPGDMPVEQPTRFELVVNLKTAKALGLTISKDVLLRADEVIR
jgi:putative tryptophan/tyrosine transport system substrate-binding protein